MPARRFSRTKLLLEEGAVQKLANASVAVFGLGGLGSYAVEALVRAGVGHLRLVDFDEIKHSNFNRQLYVLEAAVGRKKVDVAESNMCPLARMVRKKPHAIGIFKGIRCVYSVEPADTVRASETAEPENFVRGRPRPSLGSISCMPAMFGLIAAREAIKIITRPVE